MRSFYEPWIRNADNKTLTAFIEAYVAVQVGSSLEFIISRCMH
jgi:hypothetical protein